MKLKKDSLLFKTIVYNDLSMLLTGLTIIGLVVFFVFTELEKNFSKKAIEKLQEVEGMIEVRNNEIGNEFLKIVNNGVFIEKDLFDEITTPEIAKEKYSEMIKKLEGEKFELSQNSDFMIIGSDGRIFTKTGIKEKETDEEIFKFKLYGDHLKKTVETIRYNEKTGGFYLQIFIPILDRADITGALFEIPIEKNYFHENKYLQVIEQDDLKNIGIYKTDYPINEFFADKKIKNEKKTLRQDNYYVKTVKVEGLDYNIASKAVYGYSGGKIGYLIVNMAEPGLTTFKKNTMYIIILTTILLILLNSFVINETFKQLLMPLEELSSVVNEIATGNLDANLRLNGTREIKLLSMATQKMVVKLKENTSILKNQNEVLKNYISRVESVEKILLAMRIAVKSDEVIDILLEGFTSNKELDYDRAIFFRCNNESKSLKGEKMRKNNNISIKSELSTFDLRDETMRDIVPLINIEKNENLFFEAVNKRKIIFKNEKGYKFSLGSEILSGFGLTNFMIIPIFNKEETVGCILVDNFISCRRIETEDAELFSMISLNASIYFENQTKEVVKIRDERDMAISKMFKKIVHKRNATLKRHTNLITKLYTKNMIGKREYQNYVDTVSEVNREDAILFDYSKEKEYNFEKLNVNSFVSSIVEEYAVEQKSEDISLFLGEEAILLGDSIELKKVIYEILNNAISGVKDKSEKRINVITKIDPKKIIIKIRDNGTGISSERLNEDLFEPFSTGDERRSGLGLAIANKIVTSHSGSIKIKSEVNVGTEVIIKLNRYREDINV